MPAQEKAELSVLVIEPYYGGSHKSFLSGLKKRLPHRFDLLALPARKWKWRMRLAAPYFADELRKSGKRYERILCSTFVDVAAFRGLAPGWVREVPMLTYFHENQFAYPVQVHDERDFHFALTNMTTALASDALAFNSQYNLDTFLGGIKKLLRHADDMKIDDPVAAIRRKARVIPPGLDFTVIDEAEFEGDAGPPVVLWNHRWEHDKNPELFFEALFALDAAGVDFRLVVLGQAFERRPVLFDEAKKRLRHKTLHFGYARSRTEYARWLRRGDIAVSTALHEFFGLSIIEAVRAGCRPLLPARLSYPELFPKKYLYESDVDFQGELKKALLKDKRLSDGESRRLTDRFSWDSLVPAYRSWFEAAVPGGFAT